MKEVQEESVAELPAHPRLLIHGKRFAKERWRSASISLDGLLDYDEEVRGLKDMATGLRTAMKV